MVKINSENLFESGKSVKEYLRLLEFDERYIAVELNGEIVPKAMYEKTVLKDGDSMEVVRFVGGG